jgi:hypothetical protein
MFPKFITKLYPDAIPAGQYYLNVSAFNDSELAGWKFSVSGPGPNGPNRVSFLVDEHDVIFTRLSIQQVVGMMYGSMMEKYRTIIDLVVRATY